jgi:hypothetical protein
MSAAKNTAGLPKRTARHSLRAATGWALVGLWRSNAKLAAKSRQKAQQGYAASLRDCADLLEDIMEPNDQAHA